MRIAGGKIVAGESEFDRVDARGNVDSVAWPRPLVVTVTGIDGPIGWTTPVTRTLAVADAVTLISWFGTG